MSEKLPIAPRMRGYTVNTTDRTNQLHFSTNLTGIVTFFIPPPHFLEPKKKKGEKKMLLQAALKTLLQKKNKIHVHYKQLNKFTDDGNMGENCQTQLKW